MAHIPIRGPQLAGFSIRFGAGFNAFLVPVLGPILELILGTFSVPRIGFQVQSVARSDHRFATVKGKASARKCPNLSGVFCKIKVPKRYCFWFPFWASKRAPFWEPERFIFGIPLRAGSDASSISFCEDATQSRDTFCDSQHVFAGAHTRVPGWWRWVALAIHRRSKHVRTCWVPKRWAS